MVPAAWSADVVVVGRPVVWLAVLGMRSMHVQRWGCTINPGVRYTASVNEQLLRQAYAAEAVRCCTSSTCLQLVEVLGLHALLDGASPLHQPVSKRTLAMVNVCNDREVSNSFRGELGHVEASPDEPLLWIHIPADRSSFAAVVPSQVCCWCIPMSNSPT